MLRAAAQAQQRGQQQLQQSPGMAEDAASAGAGPPYQPGSPQHLLGSSTASFSPLSSGLAGSGRSPQHSPCAGAAQAQQPQVSTVTAAAGGDLQQQQQQQASGVAYVSLQGSGNGARSPSRLRYTCCSPRGGASSPGGLQQQQAGQLPQFITVEELPAGLAQESVHITHMEADEAKRCAEVRDSMLAQVDELVAYFNSLYADNELDISKLESELAGRELQLQQKEAIIQQLLASRQQAALSAGVAAGQAVGWRGGDDDGLRAALGRSWCRRRCCWLASLLLLVLLVLAIALPAGLVRRPPPGPPAFSGAPQLAAATNSSLDLLVALSQPGVVHYVLLLAAASARRALQAPSAAWQQASGDDVRAAAAGWGSGGLEAAAVACGSVYVPARDSSTSFSIFTVTPQMSAECGTAAALAAAGGSRASCARCPSLQPGVTYDLLLAASATGSSISEPVHLQASTLPGWASAAPVIRGGAAAVPAVGAASGVTAAAGASFNLAFSLSSPGSLRFAVVHAHLFARFSQRYVVYDNQVQDVAALLAAGPPGSFAAGLVASGTVSVDAGDSNFTCSIGTSGGAACACSPPALACTQQVACFGSLCDYSAQALAPNATYKVLLLPVSVDGRQAGPGVALPPFTTGPATTAPQPSPALAVGPLIGADRFGVTSIQQDKPGYVVVLATRPHSQGRSKVAAGAATPFRQLAPLASRRRLLGQQLLAAPAAPAAAAANLSVLPPDPAGAAAIGAAFSPPCLQRAPCDTAAAAALLAEPSVEALVFSQCVPIERITASSSVMVAGLANDTVYRVVLLLSDLDGNQAAWEATARTQDLTPPVLQVVSRPPPDFDSAELAVTLDEPGVLFHVLLLGGSGSGNGSSADEATAACPPVLQQGPVLAAPLSSTQVPAAGAPVTLSFAGLTANSDYTALLIARDAAGNCQRLLSREPIHTLDNVPPLTLAFSASGVTGASAQLALSLGEPADVAFMVLAAQQPGGDSGCPSAEQLFGGVVPQGASLPGPAASGNFSVASARSVTHHNVTGLASETSYMACAVAADTTRLRNRQAAPARVDFRTLDITPPSLAVAPVAGTDGNFTCDRLSTLCSLTFSSALSEPGTIAWALLPADQLPPELPAPQQLLASGGSNVTDAFPAGAVTASDALTLNDTAAINTTISGLASQARFVLLLAARDAAPTPNLLPSLRSLALTSPDITPPVFTSVGVPGVSDNNITIALELDEPSQVFFIVTPHNTTSAMPMPAEVAAGNASSAVASGRVAAGAAANSSALNASVLLLAGGLQPGSWYDVHLLAQDDSAGNMQANVTSIRAVRTTDNSPPVITALAATFTPPMTLVISANVSKPGRLLLAPRKAGQPAPSTQQVLAAVASRDPALANFTAVLPVAAAGAAVFGSLCVADGEALLVYAVANDTEGRHEGREDNSSPLASAVVVLTPPLLGQSCIPPVFLAPLQPRLAFAASSVPGSAVAGFLLGDSSAAASPAGMVWQQAAVATAAAAEPASLVTMAGTTPLPGTVTLAVTPAAPAAVSLVVRSSLLVPDANGPDGSTLRLSYQMRDAAGRTRVDLHGLLLRPLLSYARGVAPPPGAAASGNVLPDCDASGVGAASGVGLCEVAVDRRLFPAAGGAAASIVLSVLRGSAQLAASPPAPLLLQAPPPAEPFAPSSPGLLLTLPNRPLHLGEPIKLSITAVNPLMRGLTGFVIPLRYDRRLLDFRGAASAGGLWLPVSVRQLAAGGAEEVRELSVTDRAAGNPDASYRASSSIPLVDVFFEVRAATPGPARGAVSLSPGAAALLPSWAGAPHQFASWDGPGASGSLNVSAAAPLGAWAWAQQADLFNTALLTGQAVSLALRGVGISSYGSMDVDAGGPVTCGLLAAAGGASAAVSLDAARCVLQVDAVNSVPAKGLAVLVTAGASSAQVSVNVWAPANLSLSADDATLNSVLPINADASQLSASCIDGFQATQLRLRADWTNGGAAAGDVLAGADVTALASFASSNSSVAQVSGSIVKGVRPGSAVITTPASASARATITVSSEPVCLVRLTALATTGAGLVARGANASSSTPPAWAPLNASTLAWEAQQRLSWEDSSALVVTYAAFSDGAVMDVSSRAALAAALPPGAAAGGALPYALGTDAVTQLPTVTVNATVGTRASCTQSLSTSWSVCSLRLGSGVGSVHVNLSAPVAVADFSASPLSITGPGNDASRPPLGLGTSSLLSLSVLFDDGSVRHFSADARTTFAVTAGAALCRVSPAPGGGSQVVATGRSVAGSCDVTASIVFGNSTASLSATVTVLVVGLTELQLYALGPSAVALPQPLPPPPASRLRDDLVLLKCDARNYDQVTLWTLGALSNCSASSGCPLVDLNSAAQLNLSSSEPAVARLMAGYPPPLDDYPAYPLLDNRLVPFAAGSATLAAGFGATASSIALSVKDTYLPGWPAASVLSDSSVLIAANMSEGLAVAYQLLPAAQLDLGSGGADPPSAAQVAQTGVTLLPNATGGPAFYSGVASGLTPGTNYTLLAAVSFGGGAVVSSGLAALSGLLVPDTAPPSFTAAAVRGVAFGAAAGAANSSGSSSGGSSDRFTVTLEVGLDEPGSVAFALYGDPACITADPSPAELAAGANLRDAGKCNCSASACAPLSYGRLELSSTAPNASSEPATASIVSLSAPGPAFPYGGLLGDPVCGTYVAPPLASKRHTLYLLASDDLPTYKGWAVSCAMPLPPDPASVPPGPCARLTVGRCNNTPPAAESVNTQAPPFAAVKLDASASPPSPAAPAALPARAPLKGVLLVDDRLAPALLTVSAAGSGGGGGSPVLVWFAFRVSKPGLVSWWLVEDKTVEVARGWLPAREAGAAAAPYNVTISTRCPSSSGGGGSGGGLAAGAAYALWYSLADVYGVASAVQLIDVAWGAGGA